MTTGIAKINTTDHAHAKNALSRIAQRAQFKGDIIPGQKYYLLADDFVSTGSTLADLKRFIESRGGEVVGATTLAASNENSLELAPDTEAIERLKAYGQSEVENILRDYQIVDSIEDLNRVEIQKITSILAKGKKGGYNGDALYNRLRAALDAAKNSGEQKVLSKRQSNILTDETTANNGGFSMPKTNRPASLQQRAEQKLCHILTRFLRMV